jgi:hypothetical protein
MNACICVCTSMHPASSCQSAYYHVCVCMRMLRCVHNSSHAVHLLAILRTRKYKTCARVRAHIHTCIEKATYNTRHAHSLGVLCIYIYIYTCAYMYMYIVWMSSCSRACIHAMLYLAMLKIAITATRLSADHA